MINQASKVIYNELINGRLINKQQYRDGQLQPNILFDEIIIDMDRYRDLYASLGFELAFCGDAFYLRDEKFERYKDTPALKIQALLLIISKFCTEMGTRVEAVLDYKAGLRRNSIESIGEFDEVRDILKACDMKGALAIEIDNNLIARGVAFWNQLDGLVLTDGGKAIFEEMFKVTKEPVIESGL